MISLIAAMAENRVIGINNTMPWHIPGDLAHFKATTMGKPVLMGRKTYQSMGKPLPGRRNIVLTSGPAPAGCERAGSLEEALELVADVPEAMVIGGEEIYRLFLGRAQRQYLTLVPLSPEGDAYYPEFPTSEWKEVERVEEDGFTRTVWERV